MAKTVTESALMAALSFLLYLASSIPVLSAFVILVCPLPIVYVGVQYGGRRAALAALCTTVLVGLVLGPTESYLYLLPFGLTGVVTGHLLFRDEDPNRMLMMGSGILLVAMMPAAMFLEKAMGLGDAVAEMQKQILWFAQTVALPVLQFLWQGLPIALAGVVAAASVGVMSAPAGARTLRAVAGLALVAGLGACGLWLYGPQSLVSADFQAKLPQHLNGLLATWMKFPIGIFFAIALVLFYSNHLFSFLLFMRLRIPVAPPPDLRTYRMARPMVLVGLLLAVACVFVHPAGGSIQACLCLNALTIIFFMGYIGGMSLLAVLLDATQLHPLARMLISCSIMLPLFPVAIALGFLDALFRIKEWLRHRGAPVTTPLAGFARK
jgi:uncharacterized protein YybS (DUF2232 family)